jgi:hypothetical protein
MTGCARLWLIGLMWSAVACASNPSPVIPVSSSTPTLVASTTRSVVPPPTDAVVALPPIIATQPLAAPTSPSIASSPTKRIASSSTPTVGPRPAATSTPLTCPALPTLTTRETQAAVQRFEHGLMFWLQTNNEIWVLLNSPTDKQFYWRVLPNLWVEGTPEIPDNGLTPSARRYVPVRGFGQAWFTGSKPLRDELGWATDEEAGFTTTLTYYPQGFYTPDCTWEPKSGLYELKDNRGQVFQFVGAGGIAKLMTP